VILKDKEIDIQIKIEKKYSISEQNINSQNAFINNKQGDVKEILQRMVDEETDSDKKQQYELALQELNTQNNDMFVASDSEIILFSTANDGWQENNNDKYNSISAIQNGGGFILPDEADDLASEISNAIIENDYSNINSQIGNQIVSILNSELSNENSGEANPFDDDNLMPFDTSVSLDSCKGLRRDYLEEMRKAKKEKEDKYAEKYAAGLTNVTMQYLTSGVKCITSHVGGMVITAVGNSTVINCSSGYTNCYNSIVSYYRKRDSEYLTIEKEARTISDSFSSMYDAGTLQEMVIGTYLQPGSPPYTMPLITNNTSYQLSTASGKQILYVTILAAYKLMESIAKASNKKEMYKKIGIGTKYEDTDDVIATAMAAGLKAMIALTRVTTTTSYGSTGTGLLIPFGA